MAWGEIKVDQQRESFCLEVIRGHLKMAQACRKYGISRPTGYLWLNRYLSEGTNGLKNLSSKRHSQCHQTSQQKEDVILLLKAEYSKWGPKKLFAVLNERFPEEHWPSLTTIHTILKNNGLVRPRKLRRLLAEKNTNLQSSENANDIWCMDFKGWYMTTDGVKFDPFTVTDHETRYLLCSNKLKANDGNHVWTMLETIFSEYGLPLYIRSDNGPPFASSCPGRLSKLSIKLIKAGITPEWIEPGNPQENGRHERMHLTMEQEGFLIGSSLKDQLRAQEEFIRYFNFERPHEGLGQKTPGSLYAPSNRVWTGKLREIVYPKNHKTLKVRSCGTACWKGGAIYVSRVLEGEHVGIIEGEKGLEMYFDTIFLGTVTEDLKLEVERRIDRKRTKNCREVDL